MWSLLSISPSAECTSRKHLVFRGLGFSGGFLFEELLLNDLKPQEQPQQPVCGFHHSPTNPMQWRHTVQQPNHSSAIPSILTNAGSWCSASPEPWSCAWVCGMHQAGTRNSYQEMEKVGVEGVSLCEDQPFQGSCTIWWHTAVKRNELLNRETKIMFTFHERRLKNTHSTQLVSQIAQTPHKKEGEPLTDPIRQRRNSLVLVGWPTYFCYVFSSLHSLHT